MEPPEALLREALRAAPRRFRLPPLPADAAAARSSGAATALAFAIEAEDRDVFLEALAALIRESLQPRGGDPEFQALLLRRQDPAAEEFARLAAQDKADRRAVRDAVQAIAHPARIQRMEDAASREAGTRLQAFLAGAQWAALRQAAPSLPQQALARLERAAALEGLPGVRRFMALRERQGPQAGSDEALARGRARGRVGVAAEQAALRALAEVAEALNLRGGAAQFRVVSSLRTPVGFPGIARKAKEEWDAAIVVAQPQDPAADIALLAEVKATPAAAASDLSRLLRGLERLALADAQHDYTFAAAEVPVRLTGASLRALQPQGRALPPQVIYCCTADREAHPRVLGASARAVLLAEPGSLAFAMRLEQGGFPSQELLAPVWDALQVSDHLRAARHQYETAQVARAAMVHPQDLLETVRQLSG